MAGGKVNSGISCTQGQQKQPDIDHGHDASDYPHKRASKGDGEASMLLKDLKFPREQPLYLFT